VLQYQSLTTLEEAVPKFRLRAEPQELRARVVDVIQSQISGLGNNIQPYARTVVLTSISSMCNY